MSTTFCPPALSWDYVGLFEVLERVTPYGREITLVCQQDEGSGFFTVRCEHSSVVYLRPYTALLEAAARDMAEPPVIPVHKSSGYCTFSISGALHDYPELAAARENMLRATRLRGRSNS